MRLQVLFTTISYFFLTDARVDAHRLKIRLGKLEGTIERSRHGHHFHAYYGIPYGKPPVGELRFEPPVPAKPWVGVLNATQEPAPCPQINPNSNVFDGQEDCLYLHVFTPVNATRGQNLPVMVYIFGGVFKQGYPSNYAPNFFMSRDIVFVMPNYRVGALGFMTTGDTEIAGNMALKDQVLAMKWTKENIYDFGGDPNRITIHGHSSGAACVHLHTLSPLSHDLFDQAIMQSGVGSNPQHFWDRDTAVTLSKHFAAQLNCSVESSKAMKTCLKNRTAEDLVNGSENVYIWPHNPLGIFKPVIESENVEGAFLNKNPLDAPYPSKSKPWIIGVTKSESANFASRYLNSQYLTMEPKFLLPYFGYLAWTTKPSHINFIVLWLKTRFWGEQPIRNTTDITDVALTKLLTGMTYGRSLLDVIQQYEGPKHVYLFDYKYVGGYTNSAGGRNGRFLGAAHADELPIMFVYGNGTGVADEDLLFGEEMVTRWVNFAYSGDPNRPFPINTSFFEAWDPVSSSRLEFLRIKDNGGMERDYLLDENDLWRKVPQFSKYASS